MSDEKGNIIYEFLKRLSASERLTINELSDINFQSGFDNEIIDYLVENDLIKSVGGEYKSENNVYIRPNGKNILQHGSWTEYIEFKNNERQKIVSENENRQNIKQEIERLTLSELKHKETIRDQENRIRDLTEQLTFINLVKAYKWYIGFIITIGIGLGYFLSLLII